MANYDEQVSIDAYKALDLICRELGVTVRELKLEFARFELSPRRWLHNRIVKLGYLHPKTSSQFYFEGLPQEMIPCSRPFHGQGCCPLADPSSAK